MNVSLDLLEKIINNEGGVVLSEDIRVPGSTYSLLGRGKEITSSSIISQLRGRGVTSVLIQQNENIDKYQYDFDIIPTVDGAISNRTKLAVGNLINNQTFNFDKVDDVLEGAKKIVDIIQSKKEDFKYSLKQYQMETEITDQAMRIAIFAVVVASQYNNTTANPIPLEKIALAALLMNAGSIYKDADKRKKIDLGVLERIFPNLNRIIPDSNITIAQSIIDSYNEDYLPLYSFCTLLGNKDVTDADTRNMILFSRENRTGTGLLGYPLDTNSPSRVASQILSLCYLFDASITSNIEYQQTLESTLSLIQATKMGELYSFNLIKLLLCNVSLYPKQTKVKVSIHGKEEYAIVVDDHKEQIKDLCRKYDINNNPAIYGEICKIYSRPIIKIVSSVLEEVIDLSEVRDNTITIMSVVGDTVNYSELRENTLNNSQKRKNA